MVMGIIKKIFYAAIFLLFGGSHKKNYDKQDRLIRTRYNRKL